MNVLVTGAAGFIGSNLCEALGQLPDVTLLTFERGDTDQGLRSRLEKADLVYHLAGVMRPDDETEFETVNVGLTRRICNHLLDAKRAIPIVFTSSIQAAEGNPYGRSKRQAEVVLGDYVAESGVYVSIHRLGNVFGKWARPNYTSVVATFCHNIARDLEIEISDPMCEISLIYIDDVVHRFIEELEFPQEDREYPGLLLRCASHAITLGRLAELIRSFRRMEDDLILPDLSDAFVRKLYATYTSYLPRFTYPLDKKCDSRGCLAEFVKSEHAGQIFVSSTEPGVTRGNHYHRTKTEKFLVLSGRARIQLQHMLTDEVTAITVLGEDMTVVDIPPGYMHSIENVGREPLTTLFWACEPFDPEKPDTYRREVA